MKKCIIDIETSNYLPWNDSCIICIGIMNIKTSTKHVFYNENESALIQSFIDYFNVRKFDTIIGYNIAYDLRFLLSRCLKYQIPSISLFNADMNDLIKILTLSTQEANYNKPGKLGEWANYLFNETTLYENGSVKNLYLKGKIEEIIAHNHRDLDLTYRLWKRIQFVMNGEME